MNSNRPHSPPKWAERLLRWFCRKDLHEHIHGDLLESFEYQLETSSLKQARRSYIREVIGLLRPGIIRKLHLNHPFIMNISILGNYLKVAFRQIKRHKLFSGLNIFGLATSMSICLLIISLLVDQYSFDQFHVNKDKMHRVLSMYVEKGQTFGRLTATSSLSISEELKSTYPFIERSTRILAANKDGSVGDKTLPLAGQWADQDFLEMFSFEWKEGDIGSALSNPGSIVITEETAHKFFEDQEALGQLITFDEWGEYIVTGIMANVPRRSHLQFDFLIPTASRIQLERQQLTDSVATDAEMIWRGYVYVQLTDNGTKSDLNEALHTLAINQTNNHSTLDFHYESQAFNKITPIDFDIMNQGGSTIPVQLLYFVLVLGLVIIFSACFNYTNLSIARSLRRAKEVGIRKVTGAKRTQIIFQFLVESVLISWFALAIAVGLLEFLIYAFHYTETFIHQFIQLPQTPKVYFFFWIFSTFIGIIAGLLPALHLSSFEPIQVLKKLANVKLFSHIGLRKSLIVIQFSFSIIFVMSTIAMMLQQKHMMDVDLGIRTKNIINVSLQGMDFEVFAQKASTISGVQDISGSSLIPATGSMQSQEVYIENKLDTISLSYNFVTSNYLDGLELDLISGRGFPDGPMSEQEKWIIISENAVRRLGFSHPDSSIGHLLTYNTGNPVTLTILGVIKDFHHMGTGEAPRPYALRMNKSNLNYANVLVHEGVLMSTLEKLEQNWEELDKVHEFSWHFFDEKVASKFKVFKLGSQIVGLVSFLAVVIACLGMLGMSIYEVEGRTKEIGIRKVLGASEKHLIWKLSRQFFLLLGLAILIGIPISFLLTNTWLEQFHYRISLGIGVFGIVLICILLPSVLAIISQTYGAAKSNPVDSLRTE